nr:hypothetical protein [Micromonospora sp. DSM 115978]
AGVGRAAAGPPPLSSYVFEADWPVLGHVELVTSLFFDLGVYILIVGVVLELLRTLGTAVDKEDAVTTPPPPTLDAQVVEAQVVEAQVAEAQEVETPAAVSPAVEKPALADRRRVAKPDIESREVVEGGPR